MSVEISGISITEPRGEGSRDEPGVSYVYVGDRKLHLWTIGWGPDGVTRTYRDLKEERRKRELQGWEPPPDWPREGA